VAILTELIFHVKPFSGELCYEYDNGKHFTATSGVNSFDWLRDCLLMKNSSLYEVI
jgi:hypothetical protein